MEIELDGISKELNDLDFISSVSLGDSELNRSMQNQNINVYLIKSKFDDDLLEIFTFNKSFISVESYKYHYIIKLIDGSIIFTDKCHINILQVLQYDKSISILHKNESDVGYSGLIQIIFLDGLVKYFDINKREIIFEFNYGFKFNVNDNNDSNNDNTNKEKDEFINNFYKYDSNLEKLNKLRINGLHIIEILKKKMFNIILMNTNNFLENEITNSSFDFKQNLFNKNDKIYNSNLGKIHKAVENNVSAINFITKYTSNQKTVILSLINARNEFIKFDENYKKQLVSELYVENNCKF